MSGSTPPRTRLPADERRARVLTAAAAEFASRGYDGSSLRAIAAGAGVTTPVIYDHFGSKAELYAAVAEQQATALNASWTAPAGDTPRELVAATFESIFGWIETHPEGWRIIFADPPKDAAVAAALRAGQVEASAALTRIFGELPDLDLPAGLEPVLAHGAYAEMAKTAVNGLAAWWWEHRDVPRETVIEIATNLMWRGLADMTRTPPDEEPT